MLQDQSRNRTAVPAAQPSAGTSPPEPGPGGAEAGIARMLGPSAIEVPCTDADLITLASRHEKLCAEYSEASQRALALEGVGKPDLPEACRVRLGDDKLRIAIYAVGVEGRRWYAVESKDAGTRRLRRRFWRYEDRSAGEGGPVISHTPWRQAQARADEIVSTWDRWQEDIALAHRASGYTEANDLAVRLGDEAFELEHQIRAILPRTLVGLAALARFAQRLQADGEDDGLEGGILARAILSVTECSSLVQAPADLPLSDQIIACWREWSTITDPDRTELEEREASEALSKRRYALIDAAEALPATIENLLAKALALAWIEYPAIWENGWARDDYPVDGRLALDIDTAICGRLATEA